MCGIVGFSGKAGREDRRRFVALCRQSCIRGVHAFGIAWHSPATGLHVFKSTDFNEAMAAVPNPLPDKIVFHNRYSTSGDWRMPCNNQPIYVCGNVLVFNGTVDMGTKAEMEARYGIKMETDNDGEIVLLDYLAGKPFAHIEGFRLSFAGIILGGDGTMTAFRNRMRPLWLFKEERSKFISSTCDIASRAGFDENNGQPVEAMRLLAL